jgi:hypothetical protein
VRLSTAGGTLGVQGMGPLSRAKARELADAIQGELIRRGGVGMIGASYR